MSKMSELHADIFGSPVKLDMLSAEQRASFLNRGYVSPWANTWKGKKAPRAPLKPLSAKLLAVSNGLSLRVDSLKKIQGCLT